MAAKHTAGTFVLVGGGEFGPGCREFDARPSEEIGVEIGRAHV